MRSGSVKDLAGLLLILLLGSCATNGFHSLNRAALRKSQPRSIVIVKSPGPKFIVQGDVSVFAVALLGVFAYAGAAVNAGATEARIRRSMPLEDPAIRMRATLLDPLAKRFALQVVDRGAFATRRTAPADLAADYRGADLILDVRTTEWGIMSFGSGNYGIGYDGTLRLIDARSGQILAEGICTSHPISDQPGPDAKQLMADHGALLKSTLEAVTGDCIEDYRTRVLGLY
jgi:hypothetical protein